MNTITKTERQLSDTLKSLSCREEQTGKPPGRMLIYSAFASAAIVLVVATASYLNFRDDGSPSGLAERPAAAVSQPASPALPLAHPIAPPQKEITGSGYVVAPQTTSVFSHYEGTVAHIPVSAGDTVVAGQVLATIEDTHANFELKKAEAAYTSARLTMSERAILLQQAQATRERLATLTDRGAASRQQFEDATTAQALAVNALDRARQNLADTELSIAIAQDRLHRLTIRAPFAGKITKLNAKAGDTVLARIDSIRENQSLMTISNTAHLMIDADVAETSIRLLHADLRGEVILDGFPDRPFGIRIARIAPIVSAEKGTITLRLSIDTPPVGIRPNMAASIRVSVNQPEGRNP